MRTPTRAGVLLSCAALLFTLPAAPASAAPTDVKVSDHTYARYDGGTDATTADCSTNNRQQNEPTAAVSPGNNNLITAGANDYCTVGTTGDSWAGFYYSANGGGTWANSLVPGYPGDTSPAGQASPLSQLGVAAAGDPVQAWDNDGHLYYGGIGFNRARPASGSLWVARYTWTGGAAPTYDFTTIASRGTPSPIFLGHFNDKLQIEVDRGADSPFAGNVYVCWARFTASGPNNGVFLVRSTDGGLTFDNPTKLSEGVHGNQFCDVTATRNGDVYVAWRQFESSNAQQGTAAVFAKSTDGGQKFSKPAVIAPFAGWDPVDAAADPAASGQANYEACLVADSGLDACASPEPEAAAGDCGDGPLACQSGYVFFRAGTTVHITADPTASGNPDQVFVAYDASVPGSEVSTGTTYGTIAPGTGSQAAVYLTSTTTGGSSWSAPARIDPQVKGHQFFPDISADSGRLHAMWQDSRADGADGLGALDWRAVPISNIQVAANPPGAVSAGPGVNTFYASSANGGTSWTVQQASSTAQTPEFEQFGNRDTVFYGDYNFISAAGGTVFMVWTDTRDTRPGNDPRYTNGDGTDGFDVWQCRAPLAGGGFGPDTCPTAGGLDQNIYGRVLP